LIYTPYDILCDLNGQINEAGARLEGPEHGVVRTCLMNIWNSMSVLLLLSHFD